MVTALLAFFLCTASSGAPQAIEVAVPDGAPDVRFETETTTLWAGRGAVLTFRCSSEESEVLRPEVSSSCSACFPTVFG